MQREALQAGRSDPGPVRPLRGAPARQRSVLAGGSRTGLLRGVGASIAAHVLVFGGALVYAHYAPARTIVEKPIVAKLVRLGKPRDEKLLPRLPSAPKPPTPPPAAAPVVTTTPPPDVTPAKTLDLAPKPPVPTASEAALDRQKRMMEALSKLTPPPTDGPTGKVEEALPGLADGDAQGDAAEAAEGDRYLALIEQAIRRNYDVPTIITQKERLFLRCKLFLKIARNGGIESWKITEASGNPHFDRAVEASLQRTTLPPPPAVFFTMYGADGIEIGFKP